MIKSIKPLVMTIALVATASFSLHAQQATEQDGQNSTAAQNKKVEFDDTTLEQFTVAMDGVRSVADKYQAQLSGDESAETMDQIQKSAQDEMIAEITKTGLEVKTYTYIAQRVQVDQELRERVLAIVQQRENSEG